VRELRNLIERAVILSDSGLETASPTLELDSPQQAGPAAAADKGLLQTRIDVSIPFKRAKRDLVDEFEKRFLRVLLKSTGGNISKAARTTGLDRMTIHKMAQKYGLGSR